eukprot:CAMPEP_0171325226 /NCGR_PEP_ID=MMETSP0816-20121228/116674_1 /TAXON_ID=420281 /ORGANISM="Proboscia inermis, Strain CCAP1064/1" /LENGTH=68 /DNA_ID=CAMNT_0011824345 /DNA_START=791 /DNA_END=997 /DNA_ORIENTATION=-
MQEHGSNEASDNVIATATISDKDNVTVIDLTHEQDSIRNRLWSDNPGEMTRWNTTNNDPAGNETGAAC